MDLLRNLLEQRQILAILALSYGVAYLSLLIVYRSRFPKIAWIAQIELAIYLIVMGVLHGLYLYGVETGIAFGLATWLFTFAVLATSVLFLVNKSRGLRRG